MNSVALPAAGAGAQILSAEADLVRRAARGDADAFGELYRRHSAPAWRLAQAVSPDRDSALNAFRDGFVRALRSNRPVRRAGGAFRPHVLSAIYRAAADQAYDRASGPSSVRRPKGGPDAALADAAFRSLPERWRAAVWLNKVESFDSERLAAVLGVSAGVADQLLARGLKGLAGRYEQARREMPTHLGDVLRQLVIPVPADLADATTARWAATRADHLSSIGPISSWLDEHAARPLSVMAGALVGLGLIGLGVIPGGNSVHSQLGASGTGSVIGAEPVGACVGAGCPPGTTANHHLTASGTAGANAFTQAFNNAFGLGGTGFAAGGSGSNGSGSGSGTGPGGGTGNGGNNGGGSKPPANGSSPIALPGLGTLTFSGSTLSASLLNGTVSATAGTCGAQATAGTTSEGAGCNGSSQNASTSPSGTISSVTSTATKTLTTTTGSATSVVKAVTGTVTNTVGSTTKASSSTSSTTSTTIKNATGGLLSGL